MESRAAIKEQSFYIRHSCREKTIKNIFLKKKIINFTFFYK